MSCDCWRSNDPRFQPEQVAVRANATYDFRLEPRAKTWSSACQRCSAPRKGKVCDARSVPFRLSCTVRVVFTDPQYQEKARFFPTKA